MPLALVLGLLGCRGTASEDHPGTSVTTLAGSSTAVTPERCVPQPGVCVLFVDRESGTKELLPAEEVPLIDVATLRKEQIARVEIQRYSVHGFDAEGHERYTHFADPAPSRQR